MKEPNLCHNSKHSCSACCGLHNLKLSPQEKDEWLDENTANLLKMQNPSRIELLQLRQTGEKKTQPLMIDEEIYVCPFLGYIENRGTRHTGCLIHPEGSPHPKIRMMVDPQNVSLYGASICQNYNCISKERFGPLPADSPLAASGEIYHKAAPNHNLRRLIIEIAKRENIAPAAIEEAAARELVKRELPVTSFDMALNYACYNTEELWSVLGTLFLPSGYLIKAFAVDPKGVMLGKKIKNEITGGDALLSPSKPEASTP